MSTQRNQADRSLSNSYGNIDKGTNPVAGHTSVVTLHKPSLRHQRVTGRWYHTPTPLRTHSQLVRKYGSWDGDFEKGLSVVEYINVSDVNRRRIWTWT